MPSITSDLLKVYDQTADSDLDEFLKSAEVDRAELLAGVKMYIHVAKLARDAGAPSDVMTSFVYGSVFEWGYQYALARHGRGDNE